MDDTRDDPASPFDLPVALERLEGDRALLSQLAGIFRADAPVRLAAIETAVRSGDFRSLEREAHTLKNGAANFSAASTVEAARRLETLARDGQKAEIEDAASALRRELEQLLEAMRQI